ncbi:hypothetical protein GCM10009657_25290 [Oryzihumus leptocrescens]
MPNSIAAVRPNTAAPSRAVPVGARQTSTIPAARARGKVPAWIHPRRCGLSAATADPTGPGLVSLEGDGLLLTGRELMAATVTYGHVSY